jgi:steroid delta-isomerase-like uncharacterized protein
MQSPSELKALANQFFEAFNARDLERLDREIIGDEYVQYSPGVAPTRQAFMDYLDKTMTAFHNGRFVVQDMIAEGDKVLVRWTFLGTQTGPYGDHPPSGRNVLITGMDLWRYNDEGKIAEAWFYTNVKRRSSSQRASATAATAK